MSTALFGSVIASQVTAGSYIAATVCSIILGFVIALVFKQKGDFSQSYLVSLVILPVAVQMVIMLVNGNIGAGIATAGAFSLVRYRSLPGTGQEITGIFMTMAVGLATGMGYLGIAAIFAAVTSVLFLVLSRINFGGNEEERVLKITVPETLDYEGVFDDIFSAYTNGAELTSVKTANMGSLYKLNYKVKVKNDVSIKDMIDELRVRNGNLEISCSRPVQGTDL